MEAVPRAAGFALEIRLIAASAHSDSGLDICYFLAKASKERLSMLFHLVR